MARLLSFFIGAVCLPFRSFFLYPEGVNYYFCGGFTPYQFAQRKLT